MPSLLSQPDSIIEKVQSYLGPRSSARLESTHPELQKTVSKSNRYWKDSFVREVAKGNHAALNPGELAPNLAALKSAHPNSAPKGYWKARYRNEIHPVRKKKHFAKIAKEREQRIHSDMVVPGLLCSLAVAPSMLAVAGGLAVYCSSITTWAFAGNIHLMSLGLSSSITRPIMDMSSYGVVGGGIAVAAGIGSTVAMGIPITIALDGAAQLSEWNFNRQQAQSKENFVEQS